MAEDIAIMLIIRQTSNPGVLGTVGGSIWSVILVYRLCGRSWRVRWLVVLVLVSFVRFFFFWFRSFGGGIVWHFETIY